MSGNLEKELGKDACKLVQAYEIQQTKYTAKIHGRMFTEKKMDDRVRLIINME